MSESIQIHCYPTRYVVGWPDVVDDARCVRAPIADVLGQRISSDAHYVAYSARVERRLTRLALDRDAGVQMRLAILDVDGPGHVATPEWCAAEGERLTRLLDDHPGAYIYTTRGGYRIVYALPEPVPIRTHDDATAWAARYRAWCRYLAQRYGIIADESCADWTRLYRAPLVVRDGVATEPETYGDPRALGTWAPTLAKADAAPTMRRVHPHYGAVEPVPIADTASAYGQARLASAVRYLQTAPLSIEGQRGRDTFFGVCCYLVRRLRLPLEIAADCVEAIYNPRLTAAGTTTWDYGEMERRLASARDTSSAVPPGDVMTEELWTELRRAIG